jgi:hypothetical protein
MQGLFAYSRLYFGQVKRGSPEAQLHDLCPAKVEIEIVVHVHTDPTMQVLGTIGHSLACITGPGFGHGDLPGGRQSPVQPIDSPVGQPPGAFHIGQHVGQAVLHSLEAANRSAELNPG